MEYVAARGNGATACAIRSGHRTFKATTYVQYRSHVSKSMSHIFKFVWGEQAQPSYPHHATMEGQTLLCVCGWTYKTKAIYTCSIEGAGLLCSITTTTTTSTTRLQPRAFSNPLLVLGRGVSSYVSLRSLVVVTWLCRLCQSN